MISEFGGISKVMPIYAIFFMIFTLSSIGLPGLNGFVGEFLILLGTFAVNKPRAVFAATGIIFAAVYMLWMYQRVMFGEVTNPKNQKLLDLSFREVAVLVPIVLACFWIGLYPKPLLVRMEPSVNQLLRQVEKKSEFIKAMEKMEKSERMMVDKKLDKRFLD
jgi:NADH-quinone oxidoreductase subunit M